jgi:hypothetical protein
MSCRTGCFLAPPPQMAGRLLRGEASAPRRRCRLRVPFVVKARPRRTPHLLVRVALRLRRADSWWTHAAIYRAIRKLRLASHNLNPGRRPVDGRLSRAASNGAGSLVSLLLRRNSVARSQRIIFSVDRGLSRVCGIGGVLGAMGAILRWAPARRPGMMTRQRRLGTFSRRSPFPASPAS